MIKRKIVPPYDVYMHVSLLDSMPRGGSQRFEILEFVRRLRRDPDLPCDFVEKDASLREYKVKLIGRYAITFWSDHAARAVMVVKVQPADK